MFGRLTRGTGLRLAAVAAAGTLVLSSCGSDSEPESSSGSGDTGGSDSNYIAIITPSPDNPFFKAEGDAAKAKAEAGAKKPAAKKAPAKKAAAKKKAPEVA